MINNHLKLIVLRMDFLFILCILTTFKTIAQESNAVSKIAQAMTDSLAYLQLRDQQKNAGIVVQQYSRYCKVGNVDGLK
jgi:hypothetical protein